MDKIVQYLIILTVFLVLDFFWLGFVAKKFYTRHLGFLMKKKTNWLAAIIFYLIFVLGLYLFVVQPAFAKDSWTHAVLFGAIFGLITYSTYDLTNLATIKDWPLKITIVDLLWGASLSALTSTLSFLLITLLF